MEYSSLQLVNFTATMLWGLTFCVGSDHSVTCHLAEVTVPALPQQSWYRPPN